MGDMKRNIICMECDQIYPPEYADIKDNDPRHLCKFCTGKLGPKALEKYFDELEKGQVNG